MADKGGGATCRPPVNGQDNRSGHAKPRATSGIRRSPCRTLSLGASPLWRNELRKRPSLKYFLGGHTPKYAWKSGLFGLPNVDFADFSALIEGSAGSGSRHVVGSHVFQDFAPRNGRASFIHNVEIERNTNQEA